MERLNLRLEQLQEICAEVAKWREGKAEIEDSDEERRCEADCFETVGDHFMIGAGTRDMAKLCFRIALELEPNWAKPLIKLAHMVADQGDIEGALGLYQECFRLNCRGLSLSYRGENPYYHIGKCYASLGRPEDAEAYYLAGLARGECQDDLHSQLAGLWHEAGNYERAVTYYSHWLAWRGEDWVDQSPLKSFPSAEFIKRALQIAQAGKPLECVGKDAEDLSPTRGPHMPRLPHPPRSDDGRKLSATK